MRLEYCVPPSIQDVQEPLFTILIALLYISLITLPRVYGRNNNIIFERTLEGDASLLQNKNAKESTGKLLIPTAPTQSK